MKSMIVTACLLIANLAQAHIEVGVHQGTTTDGKMCTMTAGKQTFLNNSPHPLNERIKITVEGLEFDVYHPPVVDPVASVVYFNHDAFQATIATKTGAKALWIKMVHTENFEGPTSFTYIDHDWKSGQKISYTCDELKFQAK